MSEIEIDFDEKPAATAPKKNSKAQNRKLYEALDSNGNKVILTQKELGLVNAVRDMDPQMCEICGFKAKNDSGFQNHRNRCLEENLGKFESFAVALAALQYLQNLIGAPPEALTRGFAADSPNGRKEACYLKVGKDEPVIGCIKISPNDDNTKLLTYAGEYSSQTCDQISLYDPTSLTEERILRMLISIIKTQYDPWKNKKHDNVISLGRYKIDLRASCNVKIAKDGEVIFDGNPFEIEKPMDI